MSENKSPQDGDESHVEIPSSNEACGIEQASNNPVPPAVPNRMPFPRLPIRVRPNYLVSDTLPRISTRVQLLEQLTKPKTEATEQVVEEEEQEQYYEKPANSNAIPPFRRAIIDVVDAPESSTETGASRFLSRSELFERSRLPTTSSSENTSNSEDEQM